MCQDDRQSRSMAIFALSFPLCSSFQTLRDAQTHTRTALCLFVCAWLQSCK